MQLYFVQLGRCTMYIYAQFIVSCQAIGRHTGPGKINVQLAPGLRSKLQVHSLFGITISLQPGAKELSAKSLQDTFARTWCQTATVKNSVF